MERKTTEELHELFIEHFLKFRGVDCGQPGALPRLPGPSLSPADASFLTSDISEPEIHDAVWALPLGKAPGWDGLGASFFRSFWEIIKGDIIDSIKLGFTTNLEKNNHCAHS